MEQLILSETDIIIICLCIFNVLITLLFAWQINRINGQLNAYYKQLELDAFLKSEFENYDTIIKVPFSIFEKASKKPPFRVKQA